MAQSRARHSRPKITDIADGVVRDGSPEGPFIVKAQSGSYSPERGGSSVNSASNGSMVFTIRSSSSGRDKPPSILHSPGSHVGQHNRSLSKNAPARLNRSSFSGKVGPERSNSGWSHESGDEKGMLAESKAADSKVEEGTGKKKSRSRQKKASNSGAGWFSDTPILKDPRAINLVKRLFRKSQNRRSWISV